jgi:hypothetical protein
MYWIKNLMKSNEKPFFDQLACEKYFELYKEPKTVEGVVIYKVLREIRNNSRDICSIDNDLLYTYQFKNGSYKEVDLKKTARRQSAKKLFERMTSSIEEIKGFSSVIRPIADDKLILYTYFTNIGTYQDMYKLNEIPESGISSYVFSTFWNYVDLIDHNRQKRIQKMLRK